MRHGDLSSLRRWVLLGAALLPWLAVSDVAAGEWQTVRDNYAAALEANGKRIQEIEGQERAIQDPQRRAEKITRDKITALRATVKGNGTGQNLADAAETAAEDPKALADLSRDHAEYVDAAISDWSADGPERKRARDATAAAQKNLERIDAGLNRSAGSTANVTSLPALETAKRIEAAVNEAANRLRARWQLEQAARERETKLREREAGERARASGSK